MVDAGGGARGIGFVLVVVVLTAGVPVGDVAGQVGEPGFAQTGSDVDPDAVLLSVDIHPDGSADWRVEYRVRLDDDNATAAFESLQADVEANESAYVSRFDDRMTATVGAAASATDRDMAVRDVRVATSVEELPQSYGVLRYTFEWTNFAAVDGDDIHAGDAIAGLFLDDDSTLLVSWPAEYTVVDVAPSPTEQRDRSVVWRGPTDFGPGEPSLVLSPGGGPGVETSLVGLAVVGAVLVGGVTLWWWRYRSGRGGSSAAGAASSRPPEELLSNEERVIAVLDEHGGRMKQQAVVEALDWTDAKTSQVVSKLRESGRIEGFRLGRENVLRLPAADEDTPATDEETSSDGGDHD